MSVMMTYVWNGNTDMVLEFSKGETSPSSVGVVLPSNKDAELCREAGAKLSTNRQIIS